MPTSREKHARGDASSPRGWRRRVVETLVVIAVIVAMDVICSFALEQYGSLSSVMWSEYRAAAGEGIDTVVVGSSTSQRAFDPQVLDAALGTSTFSMATPAQPLDGSYTAAEQAIRDHHVRRVILGVDYESLSFDNWAGSHVAFARAKMDGEPLPQAVADYWRLLVSPSFVRRADSLCALFPWGYNHVKLDPGSVAANVRERLSGDGTLEAAKVVNGGWTYYGRGYGNYDNVIDYSLARKETSVAIHGTSDFKEACLNQVADIARLCRESGVQLVVVVTPRPAFNVLVYGEKYPEQMSRLQRVVEQGGGTFVDANLLRSEAYSPLDADFGDGEHLNRTGATRFSQAFASVLQALDAGQDIGALSYSYDRWDQYLSSIKHLSAIVSRLDVGDDGTATVTAQAYTGTDVQVEYRFLLVGEDGGTTVLQDWSSADSCDVPQGSRGQVMVCARQVGSTADYERYCLQGLAH